MKYRYKIKNLFAVFAISLMLISVLGIIVTTNTDASPSTYEDGHLQSSIWDYVNTKQQPSKALIVTISRNQWEASSAAALTPAFIDRSDATPILFDDGAETHTMSIPYETKSITEFGADISTATGEIATTYWTKAELIVVADTYEHVLWSVPIASFLSSPILINPTTTTLQDLNTKCAIVIGEGAPQVDEIIKLETREKVWQFQLELFDTKGEVCNYIIITNPHDTDDDLDSNIKWPYLSLASAPLAAYRNAIVLTGDYTTDKIKIDEIEKAVSKNDALYNELKPSFEQVKRDSYELEKFLMDNGHAPEFLTVVGGPYEVPNYFYDIHVDYKFPINTPQCTHYPSSIGAYGILKETISADKYEQEDLATGRIIASDIYDATNLLMKTFFYQEFLPGGGYYSSMPVKWEQTASIVDGHRLNQPENYPNNLIWEPIVPYHPSNWVENEFNNASLDTTYYLVRNESDPYDTNRTIFEIMEIATGSSYVQFLPHGGSTYLRIEIGIDPITGEAKSVNLNSDDVRNLNFKAPTIVYTTCCKGATPFMLDEGFKITDFMVPAFIHAGCVAYIATPEIQSTCFWTEAPYGVATEQNYLTWRNLLTENIPIGKALKDAKWSARENWQGKTTEFDPTHDVDCISYNLYGDPALEPYKPKIPFKTEKQFDITIDYDELEPGKSFEVTISVKDLESQQSITDASITTKFQDESISGAKAKLSAPKDKGSYQLEITLSKDGYQQSTAQYWVNVKKSDEKDTTPNFEAACFILATVISVLALSKIQTRRR